jgi:hypothetical protein
MDKVKFIEHNQKKILLIDFFDCNVEKALQIIEEGKSVMKQQAECSVLSLMNFNNENAFLPDLFQAMKEFARHNKPYVKASAVVVYKDMHKLFIQTMALIADRNFRIFDDAEEAKNWLAQV